MNTCRLNVFSRCLRDWDFAIADPLELMGENLERYLALAIDLIVPSKRGAGTVSGPSAGDIG